MKWFKRKVQRGQKLGRTIGFPTLNLHVGSFAGHYKPGVYSCEVKIDDHLYIGALHFGPKLDQSKNVLEIHVLQLKKQTYGKWISFTVSKKLREVRRFDNLANLQKQIKADLKKLS